MSISLDVLTGHRAGSLEKAVVHVGDLMIPTSS